VLAGIDAPKTAPAQVAGDTLDALADDVEDIFTDPKGKAMAELLGSDPQGLRARLLRDGSGGMTTVTAAGVFEQMPDHAANARWAELDDLLEPDFEIVDPALLPYGASTAESTPTSSSRRRSRAFELRFEPRRLVALGD